MRKAINARRLHESLRSASSFSKEATRRRVEKERLFFGVEKRELLKPRQQLGRHPKRSSLWMQIQYLHAGYTYVL